MSTPNSKKQTVGKLPKDWRERLFKAAVPGIRPRTEHSRLALAVAALWATGCRPVELEGGVNFSMHDGRLVALIKGGKHGLIDNGDGTFERGLEWRQFSIDPNLNDATRYLAGFCEAGPKWVEYKRTTLRTRVNELGKQIMGNIKDPPSVAPYTFRHAMACDLKSCDSLTDEQRSMVMGHLSLESLQSYGRRRRGGGGVSPVRTVRASAVPHGQISHAPPAKKAVIKHHRTQ